MTAIAPAPELALPRPALATALAFTVEVMHGLAVPEGVWQSLETEGVGSPYQRFDWQRAYVEAMGPGAFEACIVLVHDASGRPCLLLPLAVARRQSLLVASPIGGKHANFHLPLMRGDGPLPSPSELRALLQEAGCVLGIDAYAFANLPLAWNGVANPLAEGGRPSPSNGYRLALDPDGEATLQRALSKEARKKLRHKDRKLRELGPVTHRIASTTADVDVILTAFLTQKRERFRGTGIPNLFEDGATQRFLRTACLAGLEKGRPAIELHALMLGERVLAVFGGAVDADRCSGMFTSFDLDPVVARSSPGELLLSEVIRHQCLKGRRAFDLGVGEARYKDSFCDEVEALVDAMLPVTARGHLYAAALAGFLRVKRTVKQTPWLWQAFTRLRARLG